MVESAFAESFEKYPLARVVSLDSPENQSLLQMRTVVGSARTHIAFRVVENKIYLYSTIDNLLKGAASQAIENFNAINGWNLETGILHREGIL